MKYFFNCKIHFSFHHDDHLSWNEIFYIFFSIFLKHSIHKTKIKREKKCEIVGRKRKIKIEIRHSFWCCRVYFTLSCDSQKNFRWNWLQVEMKGGMIWPNVNRTHRNISLPTFSSFSGWWNRSKLWEIAIFCHIIKNSIQFYHPKIHMIS